MITTIVTTKRNHDSARHTTMNGNDFNQAFTITPITIIVTAMIVGGLISLALSWWL